MQTERRMCDVPVSFPSNFRDIDHARQPDEAQKHGGKRVKNRSRCLKMAPNRRLGHPLFRNNLDMKAFRSYRLDQVNQCLWQGERRVPLVPKAFDMLRYLVEHPGRLVTQDEILEALWPETYVNPEIIKKYILEIRKALGDKHDKPEFIETFPKRGYQFVAAVTDDVAVGSQEPSTGSAKKMVGRDTALAELDNSLRGALRGQRQIIFVTGEAGIGKTTLVDAFHQRAVQDHTLRVARGQCVEGFGGKEAYYPMLESLGQLTRNPNGNSVVQTMAKRAPTWLIQFPSLVKPEQREALQREILGATRERMVREICEALETVTSEIPLVLIFEDLHWGDSSTLDVISAVARRRETAKLLLLCTYRPVDVVLSNSSLKGLKQDLQVHQLCSEIALEPLEVPLIAEYLATEFSRGNLPAGLAKLIYDHSGGNPLFMVAIVEDMRKRGLIAQDKDGWSLTAPLETIAPRVPETLQQMMETQFAQLSAPEQRVLKSASVAGERFSVWTITTMLDMGPDQIEDLCDQLSARQQVIKSAGVQELSNGLASAHYEFRHSLYRQAIYRFLSDGTRSRLHRGLAARLETLCKPGHRDVASEVAFHFEEGRDYEPAIRHLMLAAENAMSRFAYRDSILVLQHALKLVPKVPWDVGAELELQMLELIGDAHYALGAMFDSATAYEAAASRAAQKGLRAAQVRALSCLVRPYGFIDPDRGLAAMVEAEQVSRAIGDPLLLARTEMLAAGIRMLYDAGRKEDAQLCVSAHRVLVDLNDSATPLYHKMIYAHVLVLQGNYQEAFEIFETGIPKAETTTSLMAYFFALSGKSVALLRLGRFGDLWQILQAGKQMAEKNGNEPWLFNFREAWLRTLVFDFDGARRLCDIIMRPDAGCPTGQPKAIARVAAGYAELHRGQYDKAIEYFRQVRDPEATPKFFLHWFWRMTAQLGLSNVWLASGNVVKARGEADAFLESALLTADPHVQALAWEMKTRIAIGEEEWEVASHHLHEALSIVESFTVPVAAWQVHATAWDFYQHAKNEEASDRNRALAEAHIVAIANSFISDDPLRESFLSAPPVRRVLEKAPTSVVVRGRF
jgi:DNA-binding winged helix-turn-helix (wHTH) protein/tetratricopeptide (TPR) repeat protein